MDLSGYDSVKRKLEAILNPAPLAAFREMQLKLQSTITISEKIASIVVGTNTWNNFNLRPTDREIYDIVVGTRNITEYIKAFQTIDRFTKNVVNPVIGMNSIKYFKWDLSELIESFEEEEVKQVFVDETKKVRRIIADIYRDNRILYKISSREFEEMIAELLASQGYKVDLTKQTRDGGYDILAITNLPGSIQFRMLVECKKHAVNRPIGVGIIRELKEVIYTEQAHMGMIVTTSHFSEEAYKKQKETPYLLDYRDKDNVMDWIRNYQGPIIGSVPV